MCPLVLVSEALHYDISYLLFFAVRFISIKVICSKILIIPIFLRRPDRVEGDSVRFGPLSYVTAFSGGGVKDVTSRYPHSFHILLIDVMPKKNVGSPRDIEASILFIKPYVSCANFLVPEIYWSQIKFHLLLHNRLEIVGRCCLLDAYLIEKKYWWIQNYSSENVEHGRMILCRYVSNVPQMEKIRAPNLKWWERTLRPLRRNEVKATKEYLSSSANPNAEIQGSSQAVLKEEILDLTEDNKDYYGKAGNSLQNIEEDPKPKSKGQMLREALEDMMKSERDSAHAKKSQKRKAKEEVIFWFAFSLRIFWF